MIINSEMNFSMGDIGISPENNFMIQSFMGFAWFMFPASILVATVLLSQTESKNNCLLKMLSLPVNTSLLFFAKFVVLVTLALCQSIFMLAAYYISGVICSSMQNYNFILPLLTVLRFSGLLFLSSIPMAALYMFFSVVIKSPIFSVGLGLATVVPSVLIINTKAWIAYLPSYPFYLVTVEYGKLASNMSTPSFEPSVFIIVSIAATVLLLIVSSLLYGKRERR